MQTITPDFLRTLSLRDDFPSTAKELIHVLGLEASAQLISVWGGQIWPVPMSIGGGNKAGRYRYQRMVDTMGEISARRMVDKFGGTRFGIPNLKMVICSHIKEQIRRDFDVLTTQGGLSSPSAVFELGIKHGMSGRTIEKTLKTL